MSQRKHLLLKHVSLKIRLLFVQFMLLLPKRDTYNHHSTQLTQVALTAGLRICRRSKTLFPTKKKKKKEKKRKEKKKKERRVI